MLFCRLVTLMFKIEFNENYGVFKKKMKFKYYFINKNNQQIVFMFHYVLLGYACKYVTMYWYDAIGTVAQALIAMESPVARNKFLYTLIYLRFSELPQRHFFITLGNFIGISLTFIMYVTIERGGFCKINQLGHI